MVWGNLHFDANVQQASVLRHTCHSQPYMLGMLYLSQLHLHLLAIQSSFINTLAPLVRVPQISGFPLLGEDIIIPTISWFPAQITRLPPF